MGYILTNITDYRPLTRAENKMEMEFRGQFVNLNKQFLALNWPQGSPRKAETFK